MDHCFGIGIIFGLIAKLKLCVAAALHVCNVKGADSVIIEDYIIDNRHTIYITNSN
jgi:hypothetical protein